MKKYVAIIKNVEKTKYKVLLNYLQNENHGNHSKHKTKIIEIENKNNDDFEVVNDFKILKNKQNKTYKDANGRLGQKRGKELKNSNKSLTFNIPKKYVVSEEQANKIACNLNKAIIEEYKKNGYEINENEYFGNIHYQNNTHINFILPVLSMEGKTLLNAKNERFVNAKSFLDNLQDAFSKIVDIELNENIENYETTEQEQEKFDEMIDNIDNYSLEDISLMKTKHKQNKLLKRAYDYAYKIKSKQEEQKEDTKSLERLLNTYNKIIEDGIVEPHEVEELLKVLEAIGIDRKELKEEVKTTIRKNRK